MLRNRVLSGSLLGIALLLGSIGNAQMKPPGEDISGKKHPNLAAAQRHLDMAFEKIQAAQSANEWDLAGHAAKAKELIDQASRELKQAAETSNRNHR
jgi:hypothetical protein